MVATELTRRLGLDHPLIQAGMGVEAGAGLAAAVSNARALGTLGSIGGSPEHLAEQIRACRKITQRPFAVNVVCFAWAPWAMELVDLAIAERVPVVTLSFGDPVAALERCRAAGLRTLVQVQDLAGCRWTWGRAGIWACGRDPEVSRLSRSADLR